MLTVSIAAPGEKADTKRRNGLAELSIYYLLSKENNGWRKVGSKASLE